MRGRDVAAVNGWQCAAKRRRDMESSGNGTQRATKAAAPL